jgi:hypothetical protein
MVKTGVGKLWKKGQEEAGEGSSGADPKSETASQGTKYIEWSEVWICPELSTVAI